jgi:hypothetical protein
MFMHNAASGFAGVYFRAGNCTQNKRQNPQKPQLQFYTKNFAESGKECLRFKITFW